MNIADSGANSNQEPRQLKAIDPWLIWHLQRLAAADRLGTKINARGTECDVQRMGFLLQRPGDVWPEAIPVAPYYRRENLEFASASLTPTDALSINELVPELRVSCPVSSQLAECAEESESLQPSRAHQERQVGNGFLIGFIDNGCAFGHPNFLVQSCGELAANTRVLRLWDQSSLSERRGAPWKNEVNHFGYGAELTKIEMDEVIARQRLKNISACEMYRTIGYPMQEVVRGIFRDSIFTHGTHVMDIAAGGGAFPGLAPMADLIFVQLPRYAVKEDTDQASARHILDGAAYIFAHADRLGQPAVVNVSYNAYTGPHDGSSLLERGLDELLARKSRYPRYVVMSAGNGRKSGCHTYQTIKPNSTTKVGWWIDPGDLTPNFAEIWYPSNIALSARMLRPDGGSCTPPVLVGENASIDVDCKRVGTLLHGASFGRRQQNQILAVLHPTRTASLSADWQTARDGLWWIELSNSSAESVEFNAWIERDDRGTNPSIEQSRFQEAFEECTIGGACTGALTIVVGACKQGYGTELDFSGRGPTRNPAMRRKPNLHAPGSARAAQALSSAPIRLIGTSMSAAYISGLLAHLIERLNEHEVEFGMDSDPAIPPLIKADLSERLGSDIMACVDLEAALQLARAGLADTRA